MFKLFKDMTSINDKLVVGLDIGTTKICAVVGEIRETLKPDEALSDTGTKNSVEIIGVGIASSKGMKKGVVTNIENTADSIREAVHEAETMAGVDIKAVQIGVTGGHIECLSSNGIIAVKEKEIGQKEVDSVIEAAKAVAIPFDREMLHVIPAGYTINGQNGISDPRGMGGVRLETNVRIITGAATSVQNLINSCQKAGLEVLDVVFQPLAAAEAVLEEDEKDLGSAVIDIGGGTTDIALFHEGSICHSAVLALGGNNFTNDIAIGLRTQTQIAELIKKNHGCSMMSLMKEDEDIEIGHADGKIRRKIPRRYLVEILQPRAEELFTLIKEEITGKGYHKIMNSGIVLTGGGALMEGMDVMAENILELPVRIGIPECAGNNVDVVNSPLFASAVGLMTYGLKENLSAQGFDESPMNEIGARIKGWFGLLNH